MSRISLTSACKGLIPTAALIALLGLMPASANGVAAAQTQSSISTASVSYAALINKYTNTQWQNGSWRASAGVSIRATAANKAAFKVGGYAKTADGQVRLITMVTRVRCLPARRRSTSPTPSTPRSATAAPGRWWTGGACRSGPG